LVLSLILISCGPNRRYLPPQRRNESKDGDGLPFHPDDLDIDKNPHPTPIE
jgi:hypothetical protein